MHDELHNQGWRLPCPSGEQAGSMKYHHGVPEDNRESALQLARRKKLPWLECLSLIILCTLIAGLLVKGIYHGQF